MSRNIWIAGAFAFIISIIFYFSVISCNPTDSTNKDVDIEEKLPAEYVGGQQCKSCHEEAYKDWKMSDHYQAMQHANDSTVLGDFNNATFTADGVISKFFKRDGKFFINTQGASGTNEDFEVLYTFGYYPLQQYLIAFPGGKLQSTRVSWDSKNDKWFNQYAGQNVHHNDWLHWTGNSQNWNTMCASCHSTNLEKNYDFEKDVYNTTWKDINVNCESCHGPGSTHINFVHSNAFQKGEKIYNSGFFYATDSTPQIQLNTCAPCHARKTDVSAEMVHSNEILDDLIPELISNEFYFPDGQIREEDYEYGSFAQSKMFHNNVQCTNCHNPHSGKLKKIGNELCLSCHTSSYDTEQHHFHTVNTESAQCVNCHMPAKTYMGNDVRRDHSFRVPRPDQSVLYGTPNTCNSCHSNQSSQWASDAIIKWYGPKRAYHFSDDLVPGSLLSDKSEGHLIKLMSDTSQPEIARATAVHYLGNLSSPKSAQTLLNVLNDEKALVRYHAIRSLQNFPPEVWLQKAIGNLSDKVKAVRIAAADLYHRVPAEAMPPSAQNAYALADRENKLFLQNQTDFPVGNIMLADYELQSSNYQEAIKLYLRGLKKDSLMNYARLNLSAAYNSLGQNQEAKTTLLEAAKIDPKNDRIFYNLGLLYYEMEDVAGAARNFDKALKLGSGTTGLYYNYGLLLQQQGKLKEAEGVLLKGYTLHPGASNINYALAYFYLQQKLPQKAQKYVVNLKQIDPYNTDYQQLFRNFGL